MKYRAIRCLKCGKVSQMTLSAKEKCVCGGTNMYGWQAEEKGYTCFKIIKSVKELWSGNKELVR